MNRDGAGIGAGLLALALCATAAALWPALGGALVYDDLLLVARNPALASASELFESFANAHWDVAQDSPGDIAAPRVGYWRPLTTVALFVGRALGDGAVWGHHAVSLAIHLASVALAFVLVRRLADNVWIAGATALLFGLHPVHVESVAWISAVNDPLAGALLLASSIAYLRWRDGGSRNLPWWSGAWLMLALLAKESAVAWFALAPALDACRAVRPDERRFAHPLRAFAPALAAFAVYYAFRVGVFGELAAGFDRITSHLYSSFARRLTLRVELLGGALQLLAWPAELNLFREVRPEAPWSDPVLLAAFGAIGAWALLVAWFARRGPREALAGLLIAPAALAPALLRFESIGRFPLSDRFLYVPALGAALFASALLLRRLPRNAGLALVALVAAALGARAHERTHVWRDEETLFRDGVARSPRSMYVQWGLGRVLLQRFTRTLSLPTLFEAHDAFESAQQLAIAKPADPRVLITPFDELQSSLGLGWYFVYCALHAPEECAMDEAELLFREIARRAPRSPEAHCGLGVALRFQSKFDEAEQAFARGASENPQHYESWFNLGQLQVQRGRWREGLDAFDRATSVHPASAEAWSALAMCAIELELPDRARTALKRALALAPNDAGVRTQLGVLAARERRFDDALEAFEAALKQNGASGAAHLMRAKTLLFLGRPKEALSGFLDAYRWLQEPSLDPLQPLQLFESVYNAGVLASELGHSAKAIELLEEALRRDPDGSRKEALEKALETLRAKSE